MFLFVPSKWQTSSFNYKHFYILLICVKTLNHEIFSQLYSLLSVNLMEVFSLTFYNRPKMKLINFVWFLDLCNNYQLPLIFMGCPAPIWLAAQASNDFSCLFLFAEGSSTSISYPRLPFTQSGMKGFSGMKRLTLIETILGSTSKLECDLFLVCANYPNPSMFLNWYWSILSWSINFSGKSCHSLWTCNPLFQSLMGLWNDDYFLHAGNSVVAHKHAVKEFWIEF